MPCSVASALRPEPFPLPYRTAIPIEFGFGDKCFGKSKLCATVDVIGHSGGAKAAGGEDGMDEGRPLKADNELQPGRGRAKPDARRALIGAVDSWS